MTIQTNPRARVNMLLSSVHNLGAAFFHTVSAMLVTALFLCAIAAFIIPFGHYTYNYWSTLASSYQAASAPVKPAAAQKK